MNNTLRKVTFIILGLIMIIGFIYLGKKDYSSFRNHGKDNVVMSRTYKTLDKNNIFEILDDDELVEFLTNGTGVILFCFKEAPFCDGYTDILNRIATLSGLKKVYYYDIKRERETKSYYYHQIVNKGKEYLTKNDLGQHVLSVPEIYILRDGKLIAHNNDTAYAQGNVEPNEYWNIENIIELEIKLQKLLMKLWE